MFLLVFWQIGLTILWFFHPSFMSWIAFSVPFRSCIALIMIWVAFRANLVNALQQLPQISSARAQLDVSFARRTRRLQWLDGSHLHGFTFSLLRKGFKWMCELWTFLYWDRSNSNFLCPYFEQHYFYEESTEVTTIKKKTFGLYFSKLNSFLLSFFHP